MTIKVTLINPADRRFYLAQWDDPVTGKTKSQSTKTTVRREAERFAARLEDELNAGTFKRPTITSWDEVRERYEREVSSHKAERTALKTQSMFNKMLDLFSPARVDAVADPGFISRYSAKLRELNYKPHTVRGHLAEIRKVLIWCQRMGIISRVPHIEFPRATSSMKGRPITREEFDRMLKSIPSAMLEHRFKGKDRPRKAVPPQFVDGWRHYLEGLYLSGLRLEESLDLHWTRDSGLMVDLSGRRPMFRIQAESQKSRKFQLLPMTPDLAEFLEATPTRDRRGFVFNPLTYPRGRHSGQHRPLPHHVGKVIQAIGKAARVKVNDTKFASAHDLRRAFGYRWAKLVHPQILQELMRHESIKTTQDFYVGSLGMDAADAAFEAMQRTGNTSGNTSGKSTHRRSKTS